MDDLGLDPGALGTDAAVVGAVVEATNWLKKHIEEMFGDRLNRIYPFLPFLVGIGFAYLTTGILKDALRVGIQYGLWANIGFRGYKVTLKGE